MSDDTKQPKPNFLMDGSRKHTQKRKPSRSPSPQPSRRTTPAPSNMQGPARGETAIPPPNPESAPRRTDDGEDLLKGGDTAKTDKSDTVYLPVGNYTLIVTGGIGGTGGSGGGSGGQGGKGGTGEGPKFIINGGMVTFEAVTQSIKKKIEKDIAMQYEHRDQGKSFCAKDTRVESQADIKRWLSPESSSCECIFWVTGIAGSGKSTLSATVVENLRKQGTRVAAQFFISRNIPETTNPDKIIPTIAQQLAEFSPVAAAIIHARLEKYGCPSSRQEQVEELLLAPIRELSKFRTLVVIVIDALDEFRDAAKSVPEILSTIAPRGCNLPDNVRFLITSRPEHWTEISRSKKPLELRVFKQHALNTESSVNEVHNFIVARMKEITPSHWDNWPTKEQLAELSGKANGLFHYAATALHWIEEQIEVYGETCQDTVFNEFTLLGIGQLNNLYQLILISFEDITIDLGNVTDERQQAVLKPRRKNRLCGFQHVIGTILVLQKPLTMSQIIALLADIPKKNLDTLHFLRQMRSVLIPGTTTSLEEATPQVHKSFRDYIMDVQAPAEFRILMGRAHFVTARSCLEVIVKAESQSDVVVEYSVQHWYRHLRKAVEESIAWEDGRIWVLFGLMMEEAVIKVWVTGYMMDVFVDVATVGWRLLEQNTNTDKVQGISRILMKAKERRLAEEGRRVHAFPPLPIFVLLTFSCLLVSRHLKKNLHSDLDLNLEEQSQQHLEDSNSKKKEEKEFPIQRFGMRAFLKLGKAINSGPLHGQDEGMDPFDHGFQ